MNSHFLAIALVLPPLLFGARSGAQSPAPAAPIIAARPPQPAADRRLVPLPSLDLSHMEAPVQQQIRAAQDRLANAAGARHRSLGAAYGSLGELLQVYGLDDAAVAAYRNARLLNPGEFKWPYLLGIVLASRGDLAAAALSYSAALGNKPNNELAKLRIADVDFRRNQLADAEHAYAQVLVRNPRCVPALDGLGKLALEQHQYAGAVRYLQRALGIDPQAAYLHYPLAMAYRGLNELDKASAELSKHGPAAPELVDPYLAEVQKLKTGRVDVWLRASQQMAAGRFAEAVASYRGLVNAQPNDAVARTYLGTALARAGNIGEAIAELSRAVRLAPANAKAQYCLGVVLASLGRDQPALAHLRVSVARDPQFGEAHFQLANLLMRTRQWSEAASEYARTLDRDPTNSFAALMQGMAMVRLGRYGEARSDLERAHAGAPANSDITGALARLLAAAPDDAVRDGHRALSLMQQSVPSGGSVESEQAETIAMALAENGQFEKAAALQRSLLEGAEADGDNNRVAGLRENLLLYQRGQACRTPWRKDDPIFVPVPQSGAAIAPPDAGVPGTFHNRATG